MEQKSHDAATRETYAVEVRDVFSGDDLIVWIDIGFDNLYKKQRIRLKGVNTPNAVHEGDESEGGRIRKMVKGLARGKTGQITVINRDRPSWKVELIIDHEDGPLNINEHLIRLGYAFKKGTE